MLFERAPLQTSKTPVHCVQHLAECFNQAFAEYHTILKPGADEPFYQASQDGNPATIFSTHDYFSSALHEIAHWCIAGEKRRKLNDYGYWYEPDGRSLQQQALFFEVEAKPQALEWAFSLAAGIPFRISVDNLDGGVEARHDAENFRDRVHQQLVAYISFGFPLRALGMIQMLSCMYRNHQPIQTPPKSTCLL